MIRFTENVKAEEYELRHSIYECSKCFTPPDYRELDTFTCSICYKDLFHSGSVSPLICHDCCVKENRCRKCGKLMD